MSKEEILKQVKLKYPNASLGIVSLIAMQEFADQEKEKVAVAFAEWKEIEDWMWDDTSQQYESRDYNFTFKWISDLYKYFITNVYNK